MDGIPSAIIKFGTFTFISRVGIECSGSDNNHTKGKVGVLMLNIGFPGKVLKVGGYITLYTRIHNTMFVIQIGYSV